MKGAVILAAAGLAAAQLPDLADIPQCAIGCLVPALTESGCEFSDVTCLCKPENQSKIRAKAIPCAASSCSEEDQQKALSAAEKLCGGSVSGIPSGSATSTGAASTGSQSASTGSQSAPTGSQPASSGPASDESSSAVMTSSASPTSGAGGIVPPVTSAVSSGLSTALPGNSTATSSRSASGSSSATSSGSQTSSTSSSTSPGTNDAAGPVAGVVAAIAAAVFAL